jgi:hypothetical protein
VLGTLSRPYLDLEPADELGLSDTDMISYLVAGVPSFGIGNLQQNTELATAILFGSLSSYLSSRFSGGLFDYIQIQTASDQFRYGLGPQYNFSSVLEGAQLGVGRQLGDRTFLAVTAGLCKLQTRTDIARSLGLRIEHQLKTDFGVSASMEPPLSSLLCSATADAGLASLRRQIGFDLFRIWRF